MKHRSSLIFDNSTYGLATDDMTVEITEESYTHLINYMSASKHFQQISSTNGRDKYNLWPVGSKESMGVYELYRGRGGYFLNVTANPTKLLVGDNTVPAIIAPRKGETKQEAYIRSVRYLNRLPFNVLEMLPAVSYGGKSVTFRFSGKDRKRIDGGNIHLARLQLAWYSNDLPYRTTVLSFIRLLFCGLATRTKTLDSGDVTLVSSNLGDMLNINATAWSDNFNVTLVVKSGTKIKYKIVLYAKDEELLQKQKTVEEKRLNRVSSAIRFDVTLSRSAWSKKNSHLLGSSPTMCAFEGVLFEHVTEDLLDKKYTKSLMASIFDDLKLSYLLSLDPVEYPRMVAEVKELARTNEKTLGKVAKLWLKTDTVLSRDKAAAALGLSRAETLDAAVEEFRSRTGIDFYVSRHYLDHMLTNTIEAMRSMREKRKELDVTTNEPAIQRSELIDRFKRVRKEVVEALSSVGTVKRMVPDIIEEKDIFLLKMINKTGKTKRASDA